MNWVRRWRLHHEPLPPIFDPFLDMTQPFGEFKPDGLWFTPEEGDWRDWCRDNMPDWLVGKKVSPIEVDLSRILVLDSSDRILDFTRSFEATRYPARLGMGIDWSAVAKVWDGVEIAPYCHDLRFDARAFWYHTWDVASGCCWRSRSLRCVS